MLRGFRVQMQRRDANVKAEVLQWTVHGFAANRPLTHCCLRAPPVTHYWFPFTSTAMCVQIESERGEAEVVGVVSTAVSSSSNGHCVLHPR